MEIEGESLEGRMLIAMPGMGDPRFERTLIYICSHSDDGAMGLVVNRRAEGVSFDDLMSQLEIDVADEAARTEVRSGGPVETGRGFVLHSADYNADESTLAVDSGVRLTATVDILKAMARGEGPRRSLIALGYAGWGSSQLEGELQRNGWLCCDADDELIFSRDDDAKWAKALAKIGVDPSLLSATGGSA